MLTIKEISGNITNSKADFICHCVNCQGKMGSGVAKSLRQKFPEIYSKYKEFIGKTISNYDFLTRNTKKLLGSIQVVSVENKKQNVVNMFCQNYYGYDGKKYVSYDAIDDAFDKMCQYINREIEFKGHNVVSIAIPFKFGSGLAGGNWNVVRNIIIEKINSYNFSPYIVLEIWKLEEE